MATDAAEFYQIDLRHWLTSDHCTGQTVTRRADPLISDSSDQNNPDIL